MRIQHKTWIVSCGNNDAVPDDLVRELCSKREPLIITDFCRVCLEEAERLTLNDAEHVNIVCYRPRAIQALLESCNRWPGGERVSWEVPRMKPAAVQVTQPWYPVIDRQRCTHCGQCHAFCLFGVYRRSDAGGVYVEHPLNCKEKCPACARICPEAAIIFPLLDESPLNGEPVDDEYTAKAQAERQRARLLESDPYRMLKARREARKKRLVDPEKLERALAERERCSKQQEGDR